MKESLKMLIAAIIFLIFAVMDFIELDWGVKKAYRDLKERKTWQRRRCIFEFLIGIGVIVFVAVETLQIDILIVGVGILVVICVIMWILNDKKFIDIVREK